jgi:hypothetical protein
MKKKTLNEFYRDNLQDAQYSIELRNQIKLIEPFLKEFGHLTIDEFKQNFPFK